MKFCTFALAGTLAAGMAATLHTVPVLTQAPAAHLIFLDIRGGRVVSTLPDGSDVRMLVSGRSGTPDGVAVDAERGHIYWTSWDRRVKTTAASNAPISTAAT